MQCSCGGMTSTHLIQENYQVVGRYEKCRACSRIVWVKRPKTETGK